MPNITIFLCMLRSSTNSSFSSSPTSHRRIEPQMGPTGSSVPQMVVFFRLFKYFTKSRQRQLNREQG